MSPKIFQVFFLFIVIIITEARVPNNNELPAYLNIKRCHRFSPDLNQCLLSAAETIKPHLIKGIPEIKFPPIDPFRIPQIKIGQESNSFKYEAILKNVVITGLGNYKFTQFDFDVKNLQWFLKGTIEPLHVVGDYEGNGTLFGSRADGKGPFEASLGKCQVDCYQKSELVKKGGKDFLKPITTNITITNGSEQKIKLGGLLGGEEKIGQQIQKIINDNIDILFAEFKPTIEKVSGIVIEEALFKSFLDYIPFDNLYPPIA